MFYCHPLNSGHLPVVVAMLAAATFGGTYTMAVYRHDVDPLLPYISATGNERPESCIFSQLLNLTAMFGVCTCVPAHGVRVQHYLPCTFAIDSSTS
jgi:hypothetical protein